VNPPRLRLRKSEALGDILQRVLKQDQIKEQASLADVALAWNESLGPLADHTRLLGLRGGVLHVAVDSSSALYEIRQFKEKSLLAALTEQFPKRQFRRLRLMVHTPREPEGTDE